MTSVNLGKICEGQDYQWEIKLVNTGPMDTGSYLAMTKVSMQPRYSNFSIYYSKSLGQSLALIIGEEGKDRKQQIPKN